MAIDVIHRPRPVLPEPPAPDDLEVQFAGLQGVRDELADLLRDPWFEPLRAGIDAQLSRIYRALTGPELEARVRVAHALGIPFETVSLAYAIWATPVDGPDAPTGAGDDVEAYRG